MFWHTNNSVSSNRRTLGVAHVSFSLLTGGMERLLVEYARHADRDAHRLSFYHLTQRGTPADDIEACGWPVYGLNKPAGFRPGIVLQLAKVLRRDDIDIVHTHNSGAMIYGALAARLAGVSAVVHTRHGQRFGSSRRQTRVFAGVSRLVDRIVGVSEDVSRQSVAEGVSARRVRTVRNGIDLARFKFSGGNRKGPAILVARLVPEKDCDTLLRATALVVREDPSFRLQIVGDGPCLSDVQQAIGRLQLTQHVDLLGERRDVPDLLRQASMFVLSSRTEGISLTLLEAMACGLPIVATNVGGNGEVIKHGETGDLVPVGDARQFASAMLRLWREPALADRYGRMGRRRVEDQFNVVTMVQNYESIYREVLDRHLAKRMQLQGVGGC